MASLRVFVSHSNKDNDWCEGFVAGLKNSGLDVWYDRQGLYVGAEWVKTLEQELQGRDIYLIVLTPDSWASQWVQRELSLALGQQKQIIGVLCKPTQVSGFITNYQLLDATQTGAWEAARLVAASLDSSKPAALPPAPGPQAAPAASGTVRSDVSGDWMDSIGLGIYYRLFLSQVGTKITGTGKLSFLTSSATIRITGTIDGGSLNLKATPVESSHHFHYEFNLTYLPPKKLSGHMTSYKRGLFSSSPTAPSTVTFIRQDD